MFGYPFTVITKKNNLGSFEMANIKKSLAISLLFKPVTETATKSS